MGAARTPHHRSTLGIYLVYTRSPSPAAVRASLPPARRIWFDAAYLAALAAAADTFSLDRLYAVLAEWAPESVEPVAGQAGPAR